uniref:Uncharacterized protein n=1 Tax=Arundo donax TaxID=35708 RepID=A0A0A9BXW9_ARUDO
MKDGSSFLFIQL